MYPRANQSPQSISLLGAIWSEGSLRILRETFVVIVFMWVHWHCREVRCEVCWITMLSAALLRRVYHPNNHTRVQKQGLSQSSSALSPPLDCVLNQIGCTRLRTRGFNNRGFNSGFSTVGYSIVGKFSPEISNNWAKNKFFPKNKPIRCVLRKVGGLDWLVGLMGYFSSCM